MSALKTDLYNSNRKLFNRLSSSLLERLKDTNIEVQLETIKAVHFLQHPEENDITEFLLIQLNTSEYRVRLNALTHIANNKTTLHHIIDKIADSNSSVKNEALHILSKLDLESMPINKRLFILENVLGDDADTIKNSKILIESWLRLKENQVPNYIKRIMKIKYHKNK